LGAGEGFLRQSRLWGREHFSARHNGRLDFVAAENSMGFHAPRAAHLFSEAIDYARQGQFAVLSAPAPLPSALPRSWA